MEFEELRHEDRVWKFRYSMRSMRWFEDRAKAPFFQAVDALRTNTWTMTNMSWLLAAGLLASQPHVMLDDVDELIEIVGLPAAMDAAMRAIDRSNTFKAADGADSGGPEGNVESGTGTS